MNVRLLRIAPSLLLVACAAGAEPPVAPVTTVGVSPAGVSAGDAAGPAAIDSGAVVEVGVDAGPRDECALPCNGALTTELAEELRLRATKSKYCYNRALARDRSLRGRMMIDVRLGGDGRVCSALVSQDTIGDATLASCTKITFETARFSPPTNGCVTVHVPLSFAGMADAGAPAAP